MEKVISSSCDLEDDVEIKNSPSQNSGGYQMKRRRRAVIESSDDEDDKDKSDEEFLVLEDDDIDHNSSSSTIDQNSRHQLMKRKRKAVVSSSSDEDDNISRQILKKIRAGATFTTSYADQQTHAVPLIRCVWTGTFNVFYDESIYHRRVYSFNAFLPSKASQKQRDLAAGMEPELLLEVVPKPCVWPKSFRGWGPADTDIAVYFFPPSKEHESLYHMLVAEMMECDLGMRMMEQDGNKMDIRIFTSHELPFNMRRFQGKLFLWGTFL